jgi:hypothetical protein
MTEITISIGSSTETFELWRTGAPGAYDGFGTLTIYDSGERPSGKRERYVLIKKAHVEWHRCRYGSGLYSCEAPDELTAKDIESKIWDWIEAGSTATRED